MEGHPQRVTLRFESKAIAQHAIAHLLRRGHYTRDEFEGQVWAVSVHLSDWKTWRAAHPQHAPPSPPLPPPPKHPQVAQEVCLEAQDDDGEVRLVGWGCPHCKARQTLLLEACQYRFEATCTTCSASAYWPESS